MQTLGADAGKAQGVRIFLGALAVLLFAVALVALFPLGAVQVLSQMSSVGFSASDAGWHVLGAIGGAAVVASLWAASAALGRPR